MLILAPLLRDVPNIQQFTTIGDETVKSRAIRLFRPLPHWAEYDIICAVILQVKWILAGLTD